MEGQRIGELLGQMGKLSPLDIDEILDEQRASRAKFGTIAVSMGFCEPEHIWAAWCSQQGSALEPVDLDLIGIDAQAVECLPRERALVLRAMPIRIWEDHLVVAVADPSRASGVAEAARLLCKQIKIVLASADQIDSALRRYYAPSALSA